MSEVTPTLSKNIFSIVIPIHNEGSFIADVLERIRRVKLVYAIQKEIIIVDDGSTDNTANLVEEYIKKNPHHDIQYIRLEIQIGKGAAIKKGIEKASGAYLIIQDACLAYDPKEYNELLEPIVENKADAVFGSRYSGDNLKRALAFWNAMGNKAMTLVSNMFTNLHLTDMGCSYRVFRTTHLKELDLLENHHLSVESELISKVSKIKGIRIFEKAVTYYGRETDRQQRYTWKDGFRGMYCIIKYNTWSRPKPHKELPEDTKEAI